MRHLSQKAMFPCGLLMMSWISMTASAAVTGSYGEVPTYHVNYADLDLGHRAGAEALFARIKSAARRVCESVPVSEPFRSAQTKCMDKALADAVADVGSPQLSAIYFGATATSTIKMAQK